MATTQRTSPGTQGKLALAIVRELERPNSDVYELFAQLDALPPEVVRAALAETTGASRPPEELDEDVRRVHGFPPPPLRLTCTHVIVPAAGMRLGETTAEQIERACVTWDGHSLPVAARLAEGEPHSLAGAIEHRTLDDLEGMPHFDVVLLHGDSGAIFPAGTSDVLGTIAYGKVEVSDKWLRTALQAALDAGTAQPEEEPEPESAPPKAPVKKRAVPTKLAAAAPKETRAPAKTKPAKKPAAAPKKRAVAKKKASAIAKKKPAPAKKAAKKAAVTKKSAAPAKRKTASPKKSTRAPAKKTARSRR